ncbi:hypothetical protein HK099_004434 [Clydaea vesicula]|uniref:DUF155 domain-containing protein n=1 Tax=Clydaea vesicula TaxID=447962 RepID=A0AAD5U0I2_9FUNG|nr:hypothetical protein HK099_004434 [Clydaea vesicula]
MSQFDSVHETNNAAEPHSRRISMYEVDEFDLDSLINGVDPNEVIDQLNSGDNFKGNFKSSKNHDSTDSLNSTCEKISLETLNRSKQFKNYMENRYHLISKVNSTPSNKNNYNPITVIKKRKQFLFQNTTKKENQNSSSRNKLRYFTWYVGNSELNQFFNTDVDLESQNSLEVCQNLSSSITPPPINILPVKKYEQIKIITPDTIRNDETSASIPDMKKSFSKDSVATSNEFNKNQNTNLKEFFFGSDFFVNNEPVKKESEKRRGSSGFLFFGSKKNNQNVDESSIEPSNNNNNQSKKNPLQIVQSTDNSAHTNSFRYYENSLGDTNGENEFEKSFKIKKKGTNKKKKRNDIKVENTTDEEQQTNLNSQNLDPDLSVSNNNISKLSGNLDRVSDNEKIEIYSQFMGKYNECLKKLEELNDAIENEHMDMKRLKEARVKIKKQRQKISITEELIASELKETQTELYDLNKQIINLKKNQKEQNFNLNSNLEILNSFSTKINEEFSKNLKLKEERSQVKSPSTDESTPLLTSISSVSASNLNFSGKSNANTGFNKAKENLKPPVNPKINKSDQQRLLPKRTTKQSQKLALFPGEDQFLPEADNIEPEQTHVRTIQPDHLLTRQGRKWLPRVTGYCTAGSYRLEELESYLLSKNDVFNSPKRFDEALYFKFSPIDLNHAPVDLLGLGAEGHDQDPLHIDGPYNDLKFSSTTDELGNFFEKNVTCFGKPLPHTVSYNGLAKTICSFGECFFFDYGVVVMWGLTEQEEKTVLRAIKSFEEEQLPDAEYETEEFHFLYNTSQQPKIFNDNPQNVMIKLTISHAIAQSAKMSVFEELIENTIESTRQIPRVLAVTGKIHMSRKAINQKIGYLFIVRINVNLVSNVLDVPEIFWSEPALQPLYNAIRKYLEITQRVELLNQRVSVISDLLEMLKENLNSTHGENLEWIVIVLVFMEIVLGVAMILVDFIHTPGNE